MPKPPPIPQSSDPLEAATQAVRDYCGWHIAPSYTETITLDGTGDGKIFLPTKYLTAVENLTVEGTPVEGYRWSENGWITLENGAFPKSERAVTVTITHGYDDASPVGQVIAGIIARARMAPTGNVVQQRAGTQSVTFATSGGQVIGFGLMQAEKELLQPYKLEWGPR